MQKHLYEHFDLPGYTDFLEGVTVTLIDKTDPRNPTGRRKIIEYVPLTLISMGFLGVRFEVGGSKITPPPPCLTPVRIMLETSDLGRKYTPIYSFTKYTC